MADYEMFRDSDKAVTKRADESWREFNLRKAEARTAFRKEQGRGTDFMTNVVKRRTKRSLVDQGYDPKDARYLSGLRMTQKKAGQSAKNLRDLGITSGRGSVVGSGAIDPETGKQKYDYRSFGETFKKNPDGTYALDEAGNKITTEPIGIKQLGMTPEGSGLSSPAVQKAYENYMKFLTGGSQPEFSLGDSPPIDLTAYNPPPAGQFDTSGLLGNDSLKNKYSKALSRLV